MVVRKIVKIDEALCTGCGNCIPKCAEGALQIVNGKARIVKEIYCDGLGACLGHCPQGAITIEEREAEGFDSEAVHNHSSKLQEKKTEKLSRPQWPVQLNLVPIEASFYQGADLLLVADCVPIAYPKLHETFMPGRRIMIGCPKFDDAHEYAQKLGEILKRNNVASITILHMEVPCCSGLKWIVDQAVKASGKRISVTSHEFTIDGKINS
jgi:NAD-dependent dihydropyrimidine dehydrogenase PreA subunit